MTKNWLTTLVCQDCVSLVCEAVLSLLMVKKVHGRLCHKMEQISELHKSIYNSKFSKFAGSVSFPFLYVPSFGMSLALIRKKGILHGLNKCKVENDEKVVWASPHPWLPLFIPFHPFSCNPSTDWPCQWNDLNSSKLGKIICIFSLGQSAVNSEPAICNGHLPYPRGWHCRGGVGESWT